MREKAFKMKKLSLVLVVITLGCVLLVSMGLKDDMGYTDKTSLNLSRVESDYDAKYKECISAKDVSDLIGAEAEYVNHLPGEIITEISKHVADYEASMESTINGLNTIDAHNFLHDEYQRCRTLYSQKGQSKLKKYYYLKIMRSCYVRDKKLNLSSEVQEVALQKRRAAQ